MTEATTSELTHQPDKVLRMAEEGDVVIIDDGVPTHVLMTYARYQRATGRGISVVTAMAQPESHEVDLPIDRRSDHGRAGGL